MTAVLEPVWRTDHRRVLLLHGLASSPAAWEPVRWADDLDVWSAALPWRSEDVTEWSYGSDTAGWLEQALAALPTPPDVVVAHSFAANLTLTVLERLARTGQSERMPRHVVLVSPFYRRSPREFSWSSIPELVGRFERTIADGIRAQGTRAHDPDLMAHLTRLVCDRIGPYGWTRFFEVYLRTPFLRTDLLTVPTLVVVGDADATAPPAEGLALAEDLPTGSSAVIAGAGHFPMIDDPARFAALVRQFCAT
ncbi:alpha/beta fold hydrolase [Actinokineospora sp. 24-640]